jgi:alkyl hydroperoxide reductase subunit AhpC
VWSSSAVVTAFDARQALHVNVLFAPLLLSLAAIGDAPASPESLECTYEGRLEPVAVAEGKPQPKGFTVTWLVPRSDQNASEALFVVSEDIAALPWPARFGFVPSTGDEDGPRIGYQFGDRDHVVPLPGARFPFAEKIESTPEFAEGRLRVKVEEDRKDVAGRDCRIVSVSGGPSRQETVAVERETGIIVRFESDVFLGRGDRFRMTIDLKQAKPLGDEAASRQKIVTLLRDIVDALGSSDRESGNDVSAATLDRIAKTQAELAEVAKNTPYESLSQAITRSVADQRNRKPGIAALAEKAVGSPAPPLDLKNLAGEPIDPASLKNKVLVLHFWDYDHSQLATPYGQVGYLDHLYRQREKLGVEVIGVAVDPRFGDPKQRAAALRSAKSLVSFMNLTYPVTTDDGTLLKAIGDPRSLGARLPLWVVIGPDGVVRSYKSGLYELKSNEGLKELDALVTDLAKMRETPK